MDKNDAGDGNAKMFYSITEVSRMLDIPPSTLRYWEKSCPRSILARVGEEPVNIPQRICMNCVLSIALSSKKGILSRG